MKDQIHIFSPATVANVACGFDVLGFCLNSIGDNMIIKKSIQKGIRITKISGFDLPYDIKKNVAGVSALALYKNLKPNCGFDIEIHKHIKPGSGIGSSAASAAGSVFAINELLGNPYTNNQLVAFAMKGEALASQSEHADNIAPALYGGFTLVKSTTPLKILQLPTPSHLYAVILHPQIEIKTAEARAILPKNIMLKHAITQWANVGSLVHALHTQDYQLLKQSLHDVVVEPYRKQLIPYYDQLKEAALQSGALGFSISGSGPSMFALCQGKEKALEVEESIKKKYQKTGIEYKLYLSSINTKGIKIIE